MVNYQCQRCGFTTNHKNNFRKHLNRKFPCKAKLKEIPIKKLLCLHQLDKPKTNDDMSTQCQHSVKKCQHKNVDKKINRFECRYCHKLFSSRQSKSRHEKKFCKEAKKDDKMEIISIKNKIDDLLTKLENIKTGVNINHVNTNVNTKFNIQVNNFGNENIDYITDKIYKKLLNHPLSAIPKMIEFIYFNPKHPENHNIRITNRNNKFAEIKRNNKWILKHKKEVIDDLTDNGFLTFEEYKDLNEDKLNQLLVNRFNKISNFYENHKDKINEEVELTVLNGNNNIEI